MRVTASKVGALTLCQWWARSDAQWVYTPSGPAAEFGNSVHAAVADAIEDGADVAKHTDPAVQSTAQTVVDWFQREKPAHSSWMAEPAYVLDITGSARLVGTNIGRKYPRTGETEIAGSADIVGGDNSGATLVDIKTGRRENVDPAAENAQLATLALAVHLAHGAEKVRTVLAFPGLGGVVTDEHTLDGYDLANWQAELGALVARIPTSKPQPSKKACQYCPAKASCPEMTGALAVAAPSRRLPVVMSAADIVSPEHARDQYMALRAAKSAIDAAWGALRQYVDERGPIDLGDGRQYARRSSQRESIDLTTRAAVNVMQRELGDSWALAVTAETTKTAIKSAAKEAAKLTGESGAAVERRTLEALREVGAVKSSTSTIYDETKTEEHAA